MKPLLVLFALCVSAATALVQEALVQEALAQEPVGCDKFKWPLDKERATLTGSRPAETGFGQPGPVAAAVRDNGDAAAVYPGEASDRSRTRTEIG